MASVPPSDVPLSYYEPRPLEAMFGYFNTSDSKTMKMHRMLNLTNALGYIPIVGTIVGIARIIFFSKLIGRNYSNNEKAFCCLQVARGLIEMLSVGAIFLIPDLISTINRQFESAMRKGTGFWGNFGKFKGDY